MCRIFMPIADSRLFPSSQSVGRPADIYLNSSRNNVTNRQTDRETQRERVQECAIFQHSAQNAENFCRANKSRASHQSASRLNLAKKWKLLCDT